MVKYLQRRFALSHKGAVDVIKGGLFCALQNDFVNITLHNFLKKNEFFGSPPKFTKRSGVNFGGDPVA